MPSKEESAELFAFDQPRIFANQVQSFVNLGFTMMVFREVAATSGDAVVKFGEQVTVSRNVASLMLPTDVAL